MVIKTCPLTVLTMQNDDSIEFGIGLFQQCLLRPIAYQFGGSTTTTSAPPSPMVITSDQRLIVGIEISPPSQSTSSIDEDFIPSVLQNLNTIEFSYQIHTKTGEIIREISHFNTHQSNSIQQNKNHRLTKKNHRITSNGLLVYFETFIKISPQYVNCPLHLSMTLNGKV